MGKFAALRRILEDDGVLAPEDVVEPREASWDDLALVHTPAYLNKLEHGSFDRSEIRRLGLPWSEALVRRSRLAVGGTVNAAWMALEDGIAANLAGGNAPRVSGPRRGLLRTQRRRCRGACASSRRLDRAGARRRPRCSPGKRYGGGVCR